MIKNLFLVGIILFLSACANTSPCLYRNYCQKDYWGDSQFEIFGRKSCVGDTGRWFDENGGRGGYYCASPNCLSPQKFTCKDTCKAY